MYDYGFVLMINMCLLCTLFFFFNDTATTEIYTVLTHSFPTRRSSDLIAKTAGANGVGMILTGMGRDGAAGLKALRGAGGKTFAQDNATCMVYEAPAAAVAQGAVEQQLPLDGLAAAALGAAGKLAKAA